MGDREPRRLNGIKATLAGAASLMLINTACSPAVEESSIAKLAPTPTPISRLEPTPTFAPYPTATEKPSEKVHLITFHGLNYTIGYPENWYKTDLGVTKDPDSFYSTEIYVIRDQLAGTPDLVFQSGKLFDKAQAVSGNKVEGRAAKIGETKAYRMQVIGTASKYGEPTIKITYLTIMDSKVWIISLSALQSKSKKDIEIFEQVVQSFEVPPKKTTSR